MTKLQTYLLKIINYFDTFSKEHGIDYCLMGGSALGAVRHKGFIPWDDDIDIFLTFDNYKKFCELVSVFNNKDFCFQPILSDENPSFMGKIRMKNTLYLENNVTPRKNVCQGIYIDVMILFKAGTSPFSRFSQFTSAKILTSDYLSRSGYKTSSFIKKICIFLASKILIPIFGKEHYLKKIVKYNSKTNNKYVCHLFGRANYKGSFYKASLFDYNLKLNFEYLKLPVMIGFDEYLRCRYGTKYMEMPNQKTRNSYPTHLKYVNFTSDEYIEKSEA